MPGHSDLAVLLAGLDPVVHGRPYVFVTVAEVPVGVAPVATVVEEEGVTLVLSQAEADRIGLAYDFVAAMITLRVHSALAAVGMTAAVAGRLAAAGISGNVMAGFFHDHLFVPLDRADDAVRLLRRDRH
ncbi:MAG: ACT domain-containing protein [Acidimicrobiales bacterium]